MKCEPSRRWLIAAAAVAVCIEASACELKELLGLQLTKAVPQDLVLKRFEEDNAGIVRFSFRAKAGQPAFAPLQAYATGRRNFLTSVAGVHTAASAEEAKVFLARTLEELTAKHRCRFRADRTWIGAVADVVSRDVEAHVSIGSATVVALQRDADRVVLKLRVLDVVSLIAKDPPE